MIIDVHAHVYAFPKLSYHPRRRPLMDVEEQIALMDKKGIDKAVILSLNSPEKPVENQSIGEVLYICEKYPDRFIPFCNIDPRLARRPDLIEVDDYLHLLKQYKKLGCKGVGEVTARMYFDNSLLLKLFAACEQVDMPVLFHTIMPHEDSYGVMDEIGLPRFEKCLQSFPNLTFIGHSAAFWSEISGDLSVQEKCGYPETAVKPGGKIPEFLRVYPNFYCDISAGSGFNALHRDPDHAWRFIDEFQDRLLLGQDHGLPEDDMPHIAWLQQARDAGHINCEVYEKIMWKNSNRILKLGLA